MIVSKSPFRHPLQIIVSAGQFYGDVLYYATSMFDHYLLGVTYSRPEAYYFWGYYFLMNFFWIVIPGRMSTIVNPVTCIVKLTKDSSPHLQQCPRLRRRFQDC